MSKMHQWNEKKIISGGSVVRMCVSLGKDAPRFGTHMGPETIWGSRKSRSHHNEIFLINDNPIRWGEMVSVLISLSTLMIMIRIVQKQAPMSSPALLIMVIPPYSITPAVSTMG